MHGKIQMPINSLITVQFASFKDAFYSFQWYCIVSPTATLCYIVGQWFLALLFDSNLLTHRIGFTAFFPKTVGSILKKWQTAQDLLHAGKH